MKSLFLRLSVVFCFFCCPLFLFAQLPSYLPADGLVAWYPFNGNANDESGNGYNGQAQGAILTSNRFGNSNRAYSFNGNLDNITTSLQQTNISSYTVSAWFKTNHGGWILTGRQVDSGDHSIRMLVNIDGVTAGGYGVLYGTDGDGNTDLTTTVANYNDNQWHHAVGVWDGVNSSVVSQFQMKLYIDGALVPQTPGTSVGNGGYGGHPNIPISGNSVCRFGISPGNYAPQSLVGQLDDIAIYNRALTAAEVTSLYTATAANTDGGNTTATPVPPGIPYQAEVRNESGEVLANANVNVRFKLHELTANGTVSYQETHALTTNELGLFSATIGAGTAVQGTFASINWAQTTKFLQVEVDAGNGYITMGNQQLMSVPYALYAANGPQGPIGPQGNQGPLGPAGPTGIGCLTHYIGENFGGGMIFHVYRDSSGAEHGLIVYPEMFFSEPFGDYNPSMIDCNSDWDGLSNTECLASLQTQGIARLLSDFNGGEYYDWYLPSITEFQLLKSNIFSLRKNGFLSNQSGYNDYALYGFWTSTVNSFELSIRTGHFRYTDDSDAYLSDGGFINNALAIRKF
jgi:hypothetical protein